MSYKTEYKSHATCWGDRMGSERGEWGNGEEPNRPNKGDGPCKTLNV